MTDQPRTSAPPRDSYPVATGPMPDGLEQMMVEAHRPERRATDDEAQLLAMAQAEDAGVLPRTDRRADPAAALTPSEET